MHLEIQKAHNLKGSPSPTPKKKKEPLQNPLYKPKAIKHPHTCTNSFHIVGVLFPHVIAIIDFLEMQLIVFSKAILLLTPKELCDSFCVF